MGIRFAVSIVIAIAIVALTAAASPPDTNQVPNGDFDRDLAHWVPLEGTCDHVSDFGSANTGSAACESAPSGANSNLLILKQCVSAVAPGAYAFSAKARRLAGADVECDFEIASYRFDNCMESTGSSASRWIPGDSEFVTSLPTSLRVDASSTALSTEVVCFSASPFLLLIDEVRGVIDPIFSNGFEYVPPVVSAGATLNYTENQAASTIDATVQITDADSVSLVSADVQISANYQNGADTLAFTPVGGISGLFNVATGTLSLSGISSLSNYETAFRSVSYVNSSDNPMTSARTITWTVNDGTLSSTPVTSTVAITAVNDAPVLAGAANLSYTENQAAQTISPAITVTDVDNTNLVGASVQISGNFDAGKDVLSFTPIGSITGNFTAGTLSLSGSDTLANYQSALRSIKFVNTSDNPSALVRQLSWQVNDGAASNNLSNTSISTITVTAVNDVPTGVVPAGSPYSITGNVRRSLGAGTLLAGATDPEGDTLITQLSGVPSNGATVVVNPNGSFSYNPGAGFEGAASFQFVVCDPEPGCSTPVTVVVGISGMIWFIDDSVAAGTGRLTDPINSIATFQGLNNGAGNNPAANDNIYLYAGSYTGPMILLGGQRLFGEGMSVTLATATAITPPAGSDALPTTVLANRPAWTSSGTTLTLGTGNTIRGLNIGNSSTAKISGSNFGTLTANEIALSGTGKALSLATGAFSVASAFDSIATTSSGTQGLSLAGISGGTLTIGGTTVSGSATQGILVGTTTANLSFGNTTVSAGTDGVSLQNNSGGTRTFGSLSIAGGSGDGFLHAVGGGTTTAGVTTITNPTGNGINIQNSTTAVTFANTTVDKGATGGVGVSLNANTGTITFGALTATTSNGSAFAADNNTLVVVTNATGALNATNGSAVNSSNTGWNAQFASTTSTNSTAQGVNVVGSSGSLSLGGGAIVEATGTDFAIGTAAAGSGGTANITYAGTITDDVGQLVNIQNATAGTKVFSGAITDGNDGDGNGISLTTNTGATITFQGGVVLSTGANPAFAATGGGTVNVCAFNPCASGAAVVNTIATTSATAVRISNTQIGSSNVTLRSITAGTGSGSAGIGIVLDTTGTAAANGGLVVTGTGAAASGGTIQHKTGADASLTSGMGIYLNNTKNPSFSRMQLNDFDNSAITGRNVQGFTLTDSVINGVIGTTSVGTEGPINFGVSNPAGTNGLQGTGLIRNTKISGGVEHNVEFYNQSGSMNLTIEGIVAISEGANPNSPADDVADCSIDSNSVALGGDGIQVEMQGTATATIAIDRCIFRDNKSQAIQVAANDSSIIDLTIDESVARRFTQGNEGFIVSNGNNGRLTTHITSNKINAFGGTSIFVGQTPGNANALAGGAIGLTAVVRGNTISTLASATNHAIIAYLTSTIGQVSLANILIESNTIAQNSTSGVARPFLIDAPDANTTPTWTASVINNNITFVDAGTGASADSTARRGTACFDVRGNVVVGPFGIRVRQVAPATVQLEQGVSGSGIAATVLDDNHPSGTVTSVLGTVAVVSNSTCLTAPL